MPLVRYIRSVFETDSSTSAAPGRIQTSESPFQELNGEKYTDNIRITLSNGYFVCGHEQAYPGYTLNTKANGLYFHYVVSGKGLYNGIPFRGQDVFVIRPHTRKLMICDSNDPWELYWCVWKGELAKTMANKLTRFEDNQIYHLKESIRYAELFRYVIYCHHNEKKIEKLVNSFSDMLLSDCSLNDHPLDQPQNDPQMKTVKEIQAYIAQHFQSTSVEEIAQVFHYNRRYLSSVFHEKTGNTIQDAIQDARLRCAEAYLLEAKMSVEESALHSGYSNYSAFIKAFKKKYSMTPTEFIRFYTVLS